MYRRICLGTVNTPGFLVEEDKAYEFIKDYNKPNYLSVYKYNEEQLKKFTETGTVSGIQDVVSNTLVWDLDSSVLEESKSDTSELINRLLNANISVGAIQLYFSGNKGFTIVVEVDRDLNPTQLRQICINNFGENLKTIDTSIYNASRILRIPWTKHEKGLYKIPLDVSTFAKTSVETIKLLAKDPKSFTANYNYDIAKVDENWLRAMVSIKQPIVELSEKLDLSTKPNYLSNCRYYLQNGFFKEGQRSKALLCLGATYKNQGNNEAIVYRMLKGVAENQANRNNVERFPDTDIYNNIILQLFSPQWKNGQFTCREEGNFLYDYCKTLGNDKCNHTTDHLTVGTQDVFSFFKGYAENYEKNILNTGIKSLDNKMKLMVGTSNALVAAPGTGKSSLALQVLNHNSNEGIQSIFYSYDMHSAALYVRMLQKHTGLQQDEIYHIFKTNPKKAKELSEVLNKEYKNVHFCFKSGQTTDELKETILDVQNKTGEKVKLVVIDYSELVIADVSDPTAASAQVAQQIRQIANEQNVCALTLLQPSKQFANPAEDITTYNSAKGSSSIAQALTVMLGCSRPGFSPKDIHTDRFFNITCLKNRNGGLFSLDYSWDGLRGSIDELEDNERISLVSLRENKEMEKKAQTGGLFG